jgi:hypothetical protein
MDQFNHIKQSIITLRLQLGENTEQNEYSALLILTFIESQYHILNQ